MQLSGTVISAADGAPIAGAKIVLTVDSVVLGKHYTDAAGSLSANDASDELLGKSITIEARELNR